MRARLLLVTLLVGATVTGCSDEDAVKEASKFYSPWFVPTDNPLEPATSARSGLEQSDEAEGYVDGLTPGEAPSEVLDAPIEIAPADPAGGPDGAIAEARIVPITVRRGETVGLYSKWSGVPRGELRDLNEMGERGGLRIRQPFKLMLSPQQNRAFNEARAAYFNQLEKRFFSRFEVLRLERYVVRPGDNIWRISKLHDGVPPWVLEKFNATANLSRLKVGQELLVPILNELSDSDSGAAESLFAKKEPGRKQAVTRHEIADGIVIKVGRGETLGHYCKWAGLRMAAVVSANPGMDKNLIRLGQRVRLPIPDSRLTAFYRKRRRFNGTPPPADIQPARDRHAAAGQPPRQRAPRAERPRLNDSPGEEDGEMAALYAHQRRPQAEKPVQEPAAQEPTWVRHRVRRGETAWVIAVRRYKITLRQLKSANPGKNLDRLRAGEVLKIPVPAEGRS